MTTNLRSILKRPFATSAGGLATSSDPLVTAAANAATAEWATVRKEAQVLAQTAMSSAELGVRLHALFCRCPSLLGEKAHGYTAQSNGGSSDQAPPVRPDLLPLPIPNLQPLTIEETRALYHGTAAATLRGREVEQQHG